MKKIFEYFANFILIWICFIIILCLGFLNIYNFKEINSIAIILTCLMIVLYRIEEKLNEIKDKLK